MTVYIPPTEKQQYEEQLELAENVPGYVPPETPLPQQQEQVVQPQIDEGQLAQRLYQYQQSQQQKEQYTPTLTQQEQAEQMAGYDESTVDRNDLSSNRILCNTGSWSGGCSIDSYQYRGGYGHRFPDLRILGDQHPIRFKDPMGRDRRSRIRIDDR